MKRSADGPHEKRKRFADRFPPNEFPEVKENFIWLTDFMPYARSNDFDVIVTNGRVEFTAHKRILCACSSVFSAMFEGDSACKECILADISDEALLILYETIYDTVEGRWNRKLPDPKQFKQCALLSFKYDCKMTHQWLNHRLKKEVFDGNTFVAVRDILQDYKFVDLVETLETTHITRRQELELKDFPEELILTMISEHNFKKEFPFFEKVLQYSKTHRSENVRTQLMGVTYELVHYGEYWALERGYELEKKKSAAFAKALWDTPE